MSALASVSWHDIFNFSNYAELLPLVRNSIIAGAVLGLLGGVIGVVVMARDLPFAVHGISELTFAGASGALLLGGSVVVGALVGSLLAALLLGAMRAGAPAMQITAKIPIEIIDVIQGLILLFLAAETVVRRLVRIRAERVTPGEIGTVSRTYGETTV